MAKKKEKLYKFNDSMGFMTQEEILNSDDEELQEEFFKYLDRLNKLENSSTGMNKELYI